MVRPMQTVKIYGVQDRRSTAQAKLPWVGRFTIDGRHRSKSFRTRIEADRYRGRLLQAVQDGGRFDETSGEPDAWQTPLADLHVHEWARRWVTGVPKPIGTLRWSGGWPSNVWRSGNSTGNASPTSTANSPSNSTGAELGVGEPVAGRARRPSDRRLESCRRWHQLSIGVAVGQARL